VVTSSSPEPTWHEWEGKGPYAWCYGHIDVDDPDLQTSARKFIQRLGIGFRSLILVHGAVQYSPDSGDMEICTPCSEDDPQEATWVFVV
jgi:hypothetical protein